MKHTINITFIPPLFEIAHHASQMNIILQQK